MTTLQNKNAVLMARLERRLPLGVSLQAALLEARNWIVECGLESEDIDVVEEYVSDMTDYSVLRYVQKYFSGGICGFITCCVVGL